MNFLALCQTLRSECGLSGTGPATTAGQTGEMLRLVNWINAAYMDIQAAHQDWEFLRKSFTLATLGSSGGSLKTSYAPVADIGLSDFGMWCKKTFRVYSTAAGTNSETFLTDEDYEAWRNVYLFGAQRSVANRPFVVAIAPSKALCFGPHADTGYTVVGDYYMAPQPLVNDTDIPILPTQFHMMIVYRAMMFYGGYDAAPEVYQRGEGEFKKAMDRLTAGWLPEVQLAGPLA